MRVDLSVAPNWEEQGKVNKTPLIFDEGIAQLDRYHFADLKRCCALFLHQLQDRKGLLNSMEFPAVREQQISCSAISEVVDGWGLQI